MMLMHAPRGRMIFTILLHRQTPQEFESHWRSEANLRGGRAGRSFAHRYNNVAAFAEVYWNAGDQILIAYYIRGDRRTRLGKVLDPHASASQFYFRWCDKVNILPSRNPTERAKRKAVSAALDHVERAAANQNWFVDLSHERHLLGALSMKKLFASPSRPTSSGESQRGHR